MKHIGNTKIYYDVSDLMGWNLSYLTGIQRTIVFMINGFYELGVIPELVWFNSKLFRFELVGLAQIPINVRQYLPHTQGDKSNLDTDKGKESSTSKRDKIKTRIGRDPLTIQTYKKLLEFFRSENLSRLKIFKWLKLQSPKREEKSSAQSPLCGFPSPPFLDHQGTPCIIISLSASWGIPQHNEAMYCLKKQGYFIVRMIYDMIPSLKSHYVTQNESLQFDTWVNEIFRHASLLLAISEYTKKEILRYCMLRQIAAPDVRVVRLGDVLGVNKITASNVSNKGTDQPTFIPKRSFLIFVCQFHVRKNQRLAYDAWKIMLGKNCESCPDLIFIGLPHPIVANLIDEIRRDGDVQGHIHMLADVSDHDLQWYYQHCLATIYPSYYEGWGLPVAESLTYGKVCIASHATSIPEISNLPEFIDPYNVYELVEKVQRCVNDSAWLKQKEALITETFVPTKWSTTCQQTLNFLHNDLLART